METQETGEVAAGKKSRKDLHYTEVRKKGDSKDFRRGKREMDYSEEELLMAKAREFPASVYEHPPVSLLFLAALAIKLEQYRIYQQHFAIAANPLLLLIKRAVFFSA